jgi:hypothetical protein
MSAKGRDFEQHWYRPAAEERGYYLEDHEDGEPLTLHNEDGDALTIDPNDLAAVAVMLMHEYVRPKRK